MIEPATIQKKLNLPLHPVVDLFGRSVDQCRQCFNPGVKGR